MALLHEDDLFRQSSMTFGEHLEELRAGICFVARVMWLAIGLARRAGRRRLGRGDHQEPPLEIARWKTTTRHGVSWSGSSRARKPASFRSEAADFAARGYLSDHWFLHRTERSGRQGASRNSIPGRSPCAEDSGDAPLLGRRSHRRECPGLGRSCRRRGQRSQGGARPSARRVWDLLTTVDAHARRSPKWPTPSRQKPQLPKIGSTSPLRAGTTPTRPGSATISSRRAPVYDANLSRVNPAVGSSSSKPARIMAKKGPGHRPPAELVPLARALFQLGRNCAHSDLMPLTIWHQSKDDPRVHLCHVARHVRSVHHLHERPRCWRRSSSCHSPWIFREIWLFVATRALYPHERRYVYIFLPFSICLFLAGALMAFFVAFPPVLQFLLGASTTSWESIPTRGLVNGSHLCCFSRWHSGSGSSCRWSCYS